MSNWWKRGYEGDSVLKWLSPTPRYLLRGPGLAMQSQFQRHEADLGTVS